MHTTQHPSPITTSDLVQVLVTRIEQDLAREGFVITKRRPFNPFRRITR